MSVAVVLVVVWFVALAACAYAYVYRRVAFRAAYVRLREMYEPAELPRMTEKEACEFAVREHEEMRIKQINATSALLEGYMNRVCKMLGIRDFAILRAEVPLCKLGLGAGFVDCVDAATIADHLRVQSATRYYV